MTLNVLNVAYPPDETPGAWPMCCGAKYLMALDPAVTQVSLGSTIIAEAIARALSVQSPRIDFLPGTERFGGRDQSSLRMLFEASRRPAASPPP